MAFLDILRSRKREERKPERLPKGALKQDERPAKKWAEIKASGETREKENRKPIETKKTAKSRDDNKQQPAKAVQSALATMILLKPHITERATSLAEQNVYTFRVFPSANKILIKKAIKEIYGFEPIEIRVINVPAKKRIVRGKTGIRPGFKKALVYLKKGDKIEFV